MWSQSDGAGSSPGDIAVSWLAVPANPDKMSARQHAYNMPTRPGTPCTVMQHSSTASPVYCRHRSTNAGNQAAHIYYLCGNDDRLAVVAPRSSRTGVHLQPWPTIGGTPCLGVLLIYICVVCRMLNANNHVPVPNRSARPLADHAAQNLLAVPCTGPMDSRSPRLQVTPPHGSSAESKSNRPSSMSSFVVRSLAGLHAGRDSFL